MARGLQHMLLTSLQGGDQRPLHWTMLTGNRDFTQRLLRLHRRLVGKLKAFSRLTLHSLCVRKPSGWAVLYDSSEAGPEDSWMTK